MKVCWRKYFKTCGGYEDSSRGGGQTDRLP